MQPLSDSQDNEDQQYFIHSGESAKRLSDIASIYQKLQLNNVPFEVKCHSYYRNLLLNGVTFTMTEGRGQSRYHQFIKLIDSTAIVLYNGVQILDYSISGRSYKPIKQVKNLLHLAYYQEIYTGRVYIGILYSHEGSITVQIIDLLTKKVIYTRPINPLSPGPITILHFSICCQKKSFYLFVYQTTDRKVIASIQSPITQQQSFSLELQGGVSNCHWSSELNSYIYSRENALYLLKDTGGSGPMAFQERKLQVFTQTINHCQSYDNVIVLSTETLICIYYLDAKEKEIFNIAPLIEEYSETVLPIQTLQFKNNVLLVVFQQLPVIFHFIIGGDRVKIKPIPFFSRNFIGFVSVLIDPSSTTALLFTEHYEANVTEDSQELSLGEPHTSNHKQTKRPYFKASILHLNILNTVYAMEYLPWEASDYINILVAPWSNTYFMQTKRKIVTQNWSYWIEEGLCSAIHPTSLFMAIGYRDCFKIYAILSDRLSNTNAGTNLKECTAMCYSPNGHHLAVVSNNSIYLFDSYSYCKVGHIPQQNFPIKQLRYQGDFLTSKSKNGNCFVYSVSNNYNRLISFYPKDFLSATERHLNFDYIEYDPIYDIFIVSWNSILKFYTSKGSLELYSVEMGSAVTTVHISRELRTMFIGTQEGEIVSFPWPNNPMNLRRKHPRKKVHQKGIQLIRISNDYKQIITVSVNGVLLVGKLRIISDTRQIRIEEVSHENGNKVVMNNLLKENRLMFHSESLNGELNDKIKELHHQINNDFLIHPIQGQKFSKVGSTRLRKERDLLVLKNQGLTQILDNQYGILRTSIRSIRDEIDGLQYKMQLEKDKKNRLFDQKQEKLIKKRYFLEKQQYSIVEASREQIRKLKESQQNQRERMDQQYSGILRTLEEETENKNLQYDKEIEEYQVEKGEVETSNKHCANQNLSAFLTEISSISYSNIELMMRNSKIQREINTLEFKVKDLKDPISDLQQQIKAHDPRVKEELNQKQEQIIELSSKKMKDKEFIFMKAIKDTVTINKVIDCSSNTHKTLVEQIELLQEKTKQVEAKTKEIQMEIVEQKTISVKNVKMEKGLKISFQSLKKKRREVLDLTMNSANTLKREIEALAISLKENQIRQFLKRGQREGLKTDISEVEELTDRPTTSNVKRSHTQLHKITRALYAYERVGNTLSNMKKIYNNHSLRAFDQNQDLLEHWNSLRLEREKLKKSLNKTLENVQTLPSESKEFLVKKKSKNTPFQQYCQAKSKNRRFKTTSSNPNLYQ